MEKMSTTAVAQAGAARRDHDPDKPTAADVLVIFGISGDLAKVMTFHSLYRLEARGLLQCPIVGVAADDWSAEDLREHARDAVKTCCEAAGETLDEGVFTRFADRLSYISGNFADPSTYQQVAEALGDAECPVFYLEIPPSLFGMVIKGLSEAGLTSSARVVVEKPFGHDLASADALAAEIHQYIDESQLYRIDHFLGKMGTEELLYLRFGNTMVEPIWNRNHIACMQITMAESFGVEDRGHFYDPVGALRDVVVNHLMQLLAISAMEAPAGNDAKTLKDAKYTVFRAMENAEPAHYVRGQYDGYRDIEGVAKDSTTETYAALRLHIDNWRWAGVPWFIRTGKRLPVTQTELRAVFRDPPRLGFMEQGHRRPEPNQFVVKLDPSTGTRVILDAHRADREGPERVTLDLDFALQGGEAPTPYEVLLFDAMRGDSMRFTRQDGVEETWRIFEPLIRNPPPVHTYAPGSWGPAAADELVKGFGAWHGPWVAS
jgi:glucose-6-phosphate 1-dehydrogenase